MCCSVACRAELVYQLATLIVAATLFFVTFGIRMSDRTTYLTVHFIFKFQILNSLDMTLRMSVSIFSMMWTHIFTKCVLWFQHAQYQNGVFTFRFTDVRYKTISFPIVSSFHYYWIIWTIYLWMVNYESPNS